MGKGLNSSDSLYSVYVCSMNVWSSNIVQIGISGGAFETFYVDFTITSPKG